MLHLLRDYAIFAEVILKVADAIPNCSYDSKIWGAFVATRRPLGQCLGFDIKKCGSFVAAKQSVDVKHDGAPSRYCQRMWKCV
jgi:hypothetical protein